MHFSITILINEIRLLFLSRQEPLSCLNLKVRLSAQQYTLG